jgi:hypothetical protein
MEPTGRDHSQPLPRGPVGHWEDEIIASRSMSRPLPGTMHNISADVREEKRQAQRAPERPEPTWDDDYRWGWTDQEVLTLSGAINALVGAAIGGLVGAAVWVGIVVATGLTLPYLTVLVGLLAGIGARLALEQTRPWSLGLFAALGAAVAYVAAQYGLFDVALVRQGTATGWFALSPVHFISVYVDYIIGVADDVNTALGQSGTHPVEPVFLLICMGVCWALVLRRK